MHIVLDFNPVLRNRYSGFWTYGDSLLQGLTARADVESLSLLVSRESLAQARDIACWGDPKQRTIATRLRLRWWERWWHISPWPSLKRWCGDFDVYHSIHHLMPPPGSADRKRPRVLTVHDLRRYRLGDIYAESRTDLFERAVKAADRIIAVSHSTRDDLVQLLNVSPDKIDVVHLATPGGFAPLDEPSRAAVRAELTATLDSPGPYAVTISSRDRRKNLPLTVAAFAAARRKLGSDWRLVIIGQRPRGDELDRALAEHRGEEFVHFTGLASPQRYAELLAAADIFLFLSLYEGFGLPILEAMASGVPVLAGDNSSLPEVVGDCGVLTDADSTQAVAEALVSLAADEPRRRRLAAAGIERARLFTPTRLAEQTVASYRRSLG